MADKKLTPKIISPGEAWNNFVNSKEGHNAAAVTPAYLEPQGKSNGKQIEEKQMPDLYYEAMNQNNKVAKSDRQQTDKTHSIEKERE